MALIKTGPITVSAADVRLRTFAADPVKITRVCAGVAAAACGKSGGGCRVGGSMDLWAVA
ncbi:hypothetical protein [Catenuloplanes japonicus]|uniref:hypothetical protein n=1 Tax=Catenuloplanes japonicus TaxID=33876 RepID=UPI000A69F329|nr:hypothetical protein [Catenuloplanes japonicus]